MPQYQGGYAAQNMYPDPYGGNAGAPYAAPPVDSFGPGDMSASEQSFDAGGGGMPSDGGSSVANSPDVVDDGDSSDVEGSAPAPRRHRRRRAAPAASDLDVDTESDQTDAGEADAQGPEQGTGVTYVTEDTTAPEALDTEAETADTDVAGLGNDAGYRSGGRRYSGRKVVRQMAGMGEVGAGAGIATLAVGALALYLIFKK
jgi:hypothetical protein